MPRYSWQAASRDNWLCNQIFSLNLREIRMPDRPITENLQPTPHSSTLQNDLLVQRIDDYVKGHLMGGEPAGQSHPDRPLSFKPGDGKTPSDAGLSISLPGGDMIGFHGEKQTLDTTDGSHLTVNHGGWKLKDEKGKDVTELPQLTRELRNPPWFDLSNGGTVTYDGDKTTLKYHGNTVVMDQSGLKSIEKNNKVEDLR